MKNRCTEVIVNLLFGDIPLVGSKIIEFLKYTAHMLGSISRWRWRGVDEVINHNLWILSRIFLRCNFIINET